MSDKLRNILTLALRPETGDGEATAALAAARRIVAKNGIDGIFGATNTQVRVETKTVYKDKIVYRERVIYRGLVIGDIKKLNLKVTVPARFHHSMLRHLLKCAYENDVRIDMRSCEPKNGKLLHATVFELTLEGTKSGIINVDEEIDRCIDEIKKSGVPYNPENCGYITYDEKPRGFFVRMIKKWAAKL